MTPENQAVMNQVTPLHDLLRDPVVNKAKKLRRSALKKAKSKLQIVVASAIEYNQRHSKDPLYDKNLSQKSRGALKSMTIAENLDIIIDENDHQVRQEIRRGKQLQPQTPNPKPRDAG